MCAAPVTTSLPAVSVSFGDLDECATGRDNCGTGMCANLDAALGGGLFTCACPETFEHDAAAGDCVCPRAAEGQVAATVAAWGDILPARGRHCAFPVACPAEYSGDAAASVECVSGTAELSEAQAESEDVCADVFGGVVGGAGDALDKVCSGIDFNETFCLLELGGALSCKGFFEHVRDCNMAGRPALDAFHCAGRCGSGERARGARCERLEG